MSLAPAYLTTFDETDRPGERLGGRTIHTRVRRLYRSAGHNFVGHHGKPPGTHAAESVLRLRCLAGRGIVGDRFFDYKPHFKGQITFFSMEVFARMVEALGVACTPAALRRNVLLDGIDLDQLIGQVFSLQGIWFQGTEECRPCYWMDRAVAPDAEAWLRGQGGLRARILSDGWLRLGDGLLRIDTNSTPGSPDSFLRRNP